jgi:hypothetical protein
MQQKQENEHLPPSSTKTCGFNNDGDYAYQTIQPHVM